jgi:hypothetical protein
VYSQPGYGYAFARVVLPPAADVQEIGGGLGADGEPLKRPNKDQCYVYLGGWGDTGGAVDAGLIHSPAFGHWSVFMSCEGIGLEVDPNDTILAPDQTVELEFLVPADNTVQLNVTGNDQNGVRRTVTMAMNPGPEFGWNADGTGVILKRMTTIAQDPADDFHSGSFIHNVTWQQCLIGQDKASASAWSSEDTGGYQSYPTTGQVTVAWRAPDNETDSIDLA